jgi:ABC-type iron transport system FetAB ATPase subunit
MTVLLSATDLDCGSLSGVRLAIGAGERICLGGPSGSGKTRLLRALADLDPHSGDIRLHGRAQREYPPHQWRRRVAMLPAESAWWTATVGDHMDGVDAKALSALGLPEEATRWPVERLSAGEKQRLALSRGQHCFSPTVRRARTLAIGSAEQSVRSLTQLTSSGRSFADTLGV